MTTTNAAYRREGEKFLPRHARHHNRTLVLQTLTDLGTRSRADLARDTGLTRVTISDLVSDLITDELVIERGIRTGSRPGKPAILLELNRDAAHIVAIELSEFPVFRGAILTLGGVVVHRAERPLDGATGDAAVDAAVELARELVAQSSRPLLGVGVSSPGIVDDRGRVLNAPNLGWTDVDLAELVGSATGLPTHVANDADLAALAERGSAEGSRDLLLVKVGRGVGAGLLLDGRARVGRVATAGEIGHVVVGTDGGPRCVCGKSGCLETWLSVPHLREALDAAADAGGRSAVLRTAGERLGIALAPVVGVLDLEEVIVSGPSDLLSGELAEAALATMRSRTMAGDETSMRLRMSEAGPDAGLVGAASLVLERELGLVLGTRG